MAELRGGTTIAGYTALHSGLKETKLGGNLHIPGETTTGGGIETRGVLKVIKDTQYPLILDSNGVNQGAIGMQFNGNAGSQTGYLYANHLDGSAPSAASGAYSFHVGSNESVTDFVLDSPGGNFYVGSNNIWHAGNDGSGSGLDADTLDGSHASAFLTTSGKAADSDKLDGRDSSTFWKLESRTGSDFNSLRTAGSYGASSGNANMPDSGYGSLIVAPNSDTGLQIYGGHNTDDLWFRGWSSSGSSFGGWNKVWHMNNDGAGSGLDADLLDGLQASSFLGASAKAADSDKLDGYHATDFLRSTGGSLSGDLSITGNINMNNSVLIAAEAGSTNIDHLWHDDGDNAWHMVSDSTLKATGNSKLYIGSLVSSGAISNNGGIVGSGGINIQGGIVTSGNLESDKLITDTPSMHVQMKGGGTDYHIEGDTDGFNIVETGVAKRLQVKNNGDLQAGDYLYVSKHWRSNTFTASSSGWYSMAYNDGNRASARFKIYSTEGGGHHVVEFIASTAYNRGSNADITLLNNARYSSSDKIGGVRLALGGTYDTQYLHVYLYSGTTVKIYMYDNDWDSGWIGRPTLTTGSIPSGYDIYKMELHDDAKRANVYTSTNAPDALGLFPGDVWIQY